jgi:hypothetical protein
MAIKLFQPQDSNTFENESPNDIEGHEITDKPMERDSLTNNDAVCQT